MTMSVARPKIVNHQAPNPVFNSGTPESAPHEVLQSFQTKYEPIGTAREAEAIRYVAINHAVW
jgi:hypothetical protein